MSNPQTARMAENGKWYVMDSNNQYVEVQGPGTYGTAQPTFSAGQPAGPVESAKKSFNTEVHGTIMGHLGADAVFRTARTGNLCCNFNVAVNGLKSTGQKDLQGNNIMEKVTKWFHVCCFKKMAETQQKWAKLSKGAWVKVRFEDAGPTQWTVTDGQIHYGFEFIASDIKWLDKRPQDNAYTAPANQAPVQKFVQQDQPAANAGPVFQPDNAGAATYNGL